MLFMKQNGPNLELDNYLLCQSQQMYRLFLFSYLSQQFRPERKHDVALNVILAFQF